MFKPLTVLALSASVAFGEDFMLGGQTEGAGLVDPAVMDALMSAGMSAVATCGIDISMMGAANQITNTPGDVMTPLRKFADAMKHSCQGSDEAQFRQALSDFEACSSIDLKDYIEFLPSAAVGMMESCFDVFIDVEESVMEQIQSNPMMTQPDLSKMNIKISQQCFDSYLGDNVFGNANLISSMKPENTISCLSTLSKSIPACTLKVWPIPIVGDVLRPATCLLGQMAPVVEAMALTELQKLDRCLPTKYSSPLTCDDIRNVCTTEGSSLFQATALISSFSGMPLSDEYAKVAQTNGLEDALTKYDEFQKKCSGHDWNALLAGEAHDASVPSTSSARGAVPSTSSSLSEPSSNSAGSFFGGLATGLVVAGVAWGFMVKRHRRNDVRMYDNVGYGNSLELS